MIVLSPADQNLVLTMREVINEKGTDYVYPGWQSVCRYNEYDDAVVPEPIGPSCIVGHVAWKRNDPVPFHVEGQAASHALELHGPVGEAFDEAQQAQDSGETWGVAWDRMLMSLVSENVDVSFLD